MRHWALLFGLGGVVAAALSGQQPERPWTFIVGGHTDGYLSPCGCTKPMSGGIRRRTEAIRQYTEPGRTIVLENGGLVRGASRQDQMKAETIAEALAAVNVTAINLTTSEARLGRGMMGSLASLANGRFISTSLEEDPTGEIPATKREGPFLIGGATVQSAELAESLQRRALKLDEAVEKLISEAETGGLQPILMLQGSREEAAGLATRFPKLRLIVYRQSGSPSEKMEKVGNTVLATPGEQGKHLVRLTFSSGAFQGYSPINLGPDVKDNAKVAKLYGTYLKRVDQAGLLDRLPRQAGGDFAGTEKCGSCHQQDLKVWQGTSHAHALKTLEDDGHGRDPDCVSCHVVGLEQEKGFRSRAATPQLADVGCESCHGGGAAHADAPYTAKMPKIGAESCAKCHGPTTSPEFDFLTYWQKIRHGTPKSSE
jgi:hypothetical protein